MVTQAVAVIEEEQVEMVKIAQLEIVTATVCVTKSSICAGKLASTRQKLPIRSLELLH